MTKKKVFNALLIASLILMPFTAMADLGNVIAKSNDIEISMFGSLKTLPQFMTNVDFNSDDTRYDYIIDENGPMMNHSVRNEARVGWEGKGTNWDFLVILEADYTLNKVNVDRQAGSNNTSSAAYNPEAVTANSDDFGIEKLNFGYDFGPAKLNTGWNTKFLDLMTGALIYADDHPYIGATGKAGNMTWEALYLIIQDDVYNIRSDADADGYADAEDRAVGYDSNRLDWRAYTLRAGFDIKGFTLAPIYAFSNNEMRKADVHYLGLEGFGKLGKITPRFELSYAFGDQDVSGGENLDISAYAAFAAIEIEISKAVVPYVGGYYLSGDDDGNDRDINAYNGISMNQRYTPTFGMENAFIYRFIPVLGSNIYENNFQNLGSDPGYGGSSNGARGDAPGMIMLGAGVQGAITEKMNYKTQVMYFTLAEENNFMKASDATQTVGDEVGIEFDLQLAYNYSTHFSIGNTVSVFLPGDFVEDYRGSDYDDTAIMDTVELSWKF